MDTRKFMVEIDVGGTTAIASGGRLITFELMGGMVVRTIHCAGVRAYGVESDPLVSNGKHGVADGIHPKFVDAMRDTLSDIGVDAGRAFALHQPKERPATCACYVGAAAQPYAHESSCPVHPRYADTQLLKFDGEVQDVSVPRLDDAEPDGEREDAEAEYSRALASVKTWGPTHGSLYRVDKFIFPVVSGLPVMRGYQRVE